MLHLLSIIAFMIKKKINALQLFNKKNKTIFILDAGKLCKLKSSSK